jgi:ornithine cyclodeaminase/alanine dehydrogenase-like protein (mu-crystallin family)
MSRPDASVIGLIGAGHQAITQLEGVCAVRDVKQVKVYARTEETRRTFAAEMRERLGVDVVPVDSSTAAVQGSHVVVTMTSSREPVFDGNDLEPGTMVAAAGVNSFTKREIDETTIRRASPIVVDNVAQAKVECGELMWAAERGAFAWRQAVPLSDVVAGRVPGYPSTEAIPLFESQGIGIEDIAASRYVFEKARAAGLGVELPF